jgi:uncharacterized membrane protein
LLLNGKIMKTLEISVRSPFIFCLMTCSIFVVMSCYKKGDIAQPSVPSVSDTVTILNVTYDNYAHGLLKKNCSTCHGVNGSAEAWWLNENTYENAVRYANIINTTIQNGTMPPPPKFPMTDIEKDLLNNWAKRGMPLH